jgi:hypothetical protein
MSDDNFDWHLFCIIRVHSFFFFSLWYCMSLLMVSSFSKKKRDASPKIWNLNNSECSMNHSKSSIFPIESRIASFSSAVIFQSFIFFILLPCIYRIRYLWWRLLPVLLKKNPVLPGRLTRHQVVSIGVPTRINRL